MMLAMSTGVWPDLARDMLASTSVSVAGAVLSVFVVLRRWAYLGDGIAHAGFGGIGTAVLLTIAFPSLNDGTTIFLIGAAFALATAVAMASISRNRAVSGDAAIGIFVAATLAWGFIAFGIHARLGRGGPSSWEDYLLGNASGMSNAAAALAVGFSAAVVLSVVALRRQIVLYCFDPVLAQLTGIPAGFVHYLLILLAAIVIILGMRLSGNLLVPALLVLPGAAGLRVSRRLGIVMLVAVAAPVGGAPLGWGRPFWESPSPGDGCSLLRDRRSSRYYSWNFWPSTLPVALSRIRIDGQFADKTSQMTTLQEERTVPKNRVTARVWWSLLALMVMAVGAAMRLWFYVYNRSMYRDEAALALNIVHRSFAGLLKPLDNDQGAPVGFLLLEKLVVRLLGNHEYSLRLVPLIASILALPLLYWLGRQFLSRPLAIIALIVVALGEKQYDYSTQTKQYSLDVLVTVALLLLAVKAIGNPLRGTGASRRGLLALAIAGSLAIWFSHPAIFVLGAIGVMAAMEWVIGDSRLRAVDLAAMAAAWIASFALNYHFILHRLSHDDYMQWFWAQADAFAPLPKSVNALVWYKTQFFAMFENPCSLGFAGLAALVFVLGVAWLYRQWKSAALMIILPIVFALTASLVHRYPFKERLILFICPLIAIFIGAGFAYLFEGQRKTVGVVALVFLLITPLNKTRQYIRRPWLHTDMRKVMSLVAANRQPADRVYIYQYCYYPYQYYEDRFGLTGMPAIVGREDVEGVAGYAKEFAKFKGQRVWVMFEDAPAQMGAALMVLDQMGQRVFEARPFEDQDVFFDYVACYELR